MKQLYSSFFLLMMFVFSYTKENIAPSQSQQAKVKLYTSETIGERSSHFGTIKYTAITGKSVMTNSSIWDYHIKNYSNFKVTAVVERIERSGGSIISRIKKTIKLKPKENKYVGGGTYSVFSTNSITWSIVEDRKGW